MLNGCLFVCLLQCTLVVCCSVRYIGCLLQFKLHWLFVVVYIGCLSQCTLVVCYSLRWLFVAVYVVCYSLRYIGCLLQFRLFVVIYVGCLLQFKLHWLFVVV